MKHDQSWAAKFRSKLASSVLFAIAVTTGTLRDPQLSFENGITLHLSNPWTFGIMVVLTAAALAFFRCLDPLPMFRSLPKVTKDEHRSQVDALNDAPVSERGDRAAS